MLLGPCHFDRVFSTVHFPLSTFWIPGGGHFFSSIPSFSDNLSYHGPNIVEPAEQYLEHLNVQIRINLSSLKLSSLLFCCNDQTKKKKISTKREVAVSQR